MELPQIPELMGLSLLVGLLALMATAAVARGWLRAEEEKTDQPVCKLDPAGWWCSVGTSLPGAAWSAEARLTGVSFPCCETSFPCREWVATRGQVPLDPVCCAALLWVVVGPPLCRGATKTGQFQS